MFLLALLHVSMYIHHPQGVSCYVRQSQNILKNENFCMWMEGVQTAMPTGNLRSEQWRNREEWHLVCGRWRQLLKETGWTD